MEVINEKEEFLVNLLGKIQKKESQLKLLEETQKSTHLLHSKIISSIQPKVGIKFNQIDLEEKKNQLLANLRKELLLVAIQEKKRELSIYTTEFETKKKQYEDNHNTNKKELYDKLHKQSAVVTKRMNKKMNKKISFHYQELTELKNFTSRRRFEIKKKPSKRRTKINRKNYKKKHKEKKREHIEKIVKRISEENIVINLSNADIPHATILYLAKGLGFVKSHKVDKQDLKFDTLEFLRKVEWKGFFKNHPELTTNVEDIHADLNVSSGKSPTTQHPLVEDIKTKLLGWIGNHKIKTPMKNLTELELRGRKWMVDKTNNKELFVTKADKGGATLIMNYEDVQEAIETELYNTDKFEEISKNAHKHLSDVMEKVISLTKELDQKKILTSKDKKLICGLNENNRLKLEPEYRAEPPYAYPLFKIHKLSENEIERKVIPPNRLVHASKFGPLYRIEKWCSPYLTDISRKYCENEFILDTNDLLKQIDNLNNTKIFKGDNIYLFTLDVEKLYPSIQPDKALIAINDTLLKDTQTKKVTKEALGKFIKFCFNEAYVTYKDNCYKGKNGIPTGGCISRQIADIFLHWVLFVKSHLKMDKLLTLPFWKRFIDDCIGIWRGTERQFRNFVRKLNIETNKFGINFPLKEIKFGKSVDFLDVTLYLDGENNILYKSFSKPTDAKRYLKTTSFHPQHVFSSVPTSQITRVFNRNSEIETLDTELNIVKTNLMKSGYNENILNKMESEIREKRENINIERATRTESPNQNMLTFPISYFDGLKEFKNIIFELKEDFQTIMGEVNLIFSIKRGRTIGSRMVQNKGLSISSNGNGSSQKCNTGGCLQCPLVTTKKTITVNKQIIKIPHHLNCKSNNAIYLWKCNLCNEEDSYFGRTVQRCHKRTNGHRACFNNGDIHKSALSMHAMDKHPGDITLENFEIAIVKQTSPRNLKREEFRMIDKCRTKCLGLNRYKTFI